MNILKHIRYLFRVVKRINQMSSSIDKEEFECTRLKGEILRNAHSIEKGLSLENVRSGFGYQKIIETFQMIEKYIAKGGNKNHEAVIMFLDALYAYLQYHEKISYTDEHLSEIKCIYDKVVRDVERHEETIGGFMEVTKKEFDIYEKEILYKLFSERHSVREFEHTPVEDRKIRKAIELAMRCPSACNRQGYRVHILKREDFGILEGWLDGTGGFADDVDQFLIITAVLSLYRKSEELQYIVTSSVFAGYLTLSLQVEGIGCCFVQRDVLPSPKWREISKKLRISQDEQVICILGIGNLKEQYKVPVSHRLRYDEIVTLHDMEK